MAPRKFPYTLTPSSASSTSTTATRLASAGWNTWWVITHLAIEPRPEVGPHDDARLPRAAQPGCGGKRDLPHTEQR